MKTIQILFWSLFLTFAQGTSAQNTRNRINFNADWKFSLSNNILYAAEKYQDKDWHNINLPHDWSVEFDFSDKNTGRNAFLPGGIAWYRKTFEIPNDYKGKHIEIQFDGIYKDSKIWVNGYPVGAQHDGYTSFYFDITELLHAGKSNTISVKVDNSIQPNCRWYSGSGIYRDVWLTVVNSAHIETWGTYITTPEVSATQAIVVVETTIENMSSSKNLVLETVVLDSNQKEVGRTSASYSIGNYRKGVVNQNLKITQPKLWSPQTPQLYTAKTQLKENGVIIDQYQSRFGIRDLKFDADKGFFINGKNMKMKGVCLHHDAGVLGAAVPTEVWKRRLLQLRAIGCNAIRTAHNPPSVDFLDLCDELGFLVMEEFVDKWDDGVVVDKKTNNPFFDDPYTDPFFFEEWKKNYGETIRRDRNHPSVIIWSVGNENHSPGEDDENNGMKNYGAFIRTLDPTRPVISGMERGKDKPVNEKVNDIIETGQFMDLIALNYGEQWCKLIHDKKPGKPFVSTESYIYFNSELEKRFANIERSPWLDVLDNNNNMGLFLWAGIDYLGESKKLPSLGSTSGILDMAGFRKSISYLYEAFWSEKPMVYVAIYKGDADDFSTSGRWSSPPMDENWNLEKGKVVDLVTYTNCESVDLYLNNIKIGNQKLADIPNWIMKWRKVNYQEGTLKAVGIINGKAVCESVIKTTGKPVRSILTVDKKEVTTGGVVQVEIDLVDSKGNRVVSDDKELKFKLNGQGLILGLSNGDIQCLDSFRLIETKKTHQGKVLCIMKAGNSAGQMSLVVSGEGIATTSTNVVVK
ncbi:glycoside hydrolase family 2 TIM barrel-domain containing protein [Flavobacterium ovatum]|uniref:glycoside hydrolase family 2 TIM barrel-domain containing protein n=1 Tax=Flavobacterium ovatum TaxID=1928857 RepID=UPI00344D94AA